MNAVAVAALCVAAAVAQRGRDRAGRETSRSRSQPFRSSWRPLCLALSAPWLCAISSMLGEGVRPLTRWVSYTASRAIQELRPDLVAYRFRLMTSIGLRSRGRALCPRFSISLRARVSLGAGHGGPSAALRETGPLSLRIRRRPRFRDARGCRNDTLPSVVGHRLWSGGLQAAWPWALECSGEGPDPASFRLSSVVCPRCWGLDLRVPQSPREGVVGSTAFLGTGPGSPAFVRAVSG